jgi:hypothetical protein
MDDAIARHCGQIERCNQRGGRMLSAVDLVEAGTVSRELAAYCLAAIGRGASFLVGAVPGGAGKTTVMGALLNFVPADVELVPADGLDAIRSGLRSPAPRKCFICHEIGRGDYYAYLWGEELRAYFELPGAGHMLATNLHADTFEQARDQICAGSGVPEESLRRMNLMLFLHVGRGWSRASRRIAEVWESDGGEPHRRVYAAEDGGQAESGLVNAAALAEARRTVDCVLSSGARTIEDVRAAVLRQRGELAGT